MKAIYVFLCTTVQTFLRNRNVHWISSFILCMNVYSCRKTVFNTVLTTLCNWIVKLKLNRLKNVCTSILFFKLFDNCTWMRKQSADNWIFYCLLVYSVFEMINKHMYNKSS